MTSSKIVCLCSHQNWKIRYLVPALGDQLVLKSVKDHMSANSSAAASGRADESPTSSGTVGMGSDAFHTWWVVRVVMFFSRECTPCRINGSHKAKDMTVNRETGRP